jgi:lysophospholipase L1-like esterase
MQTLALVGDSILDNGPYTRPEPDTADHLRRALGRDWTIVLAARDGSTMADLAFQLRDVPAPTDLLVLSIGGNDATDHIGLLDPKPTTTLELLATLQDLADDFGRKYRSAVAALKPLARRLAVCTIYEPPLIDPETARVARVPLTLLNDRIIREASQASCDVLDLRAVCTDSRDFVKEIEPSPAGAAKIAAAIAGLVDGRAPIGRHVRLFAT